MFTPSHTTQSRHAHRPDRKPRRGVALVFVLIFVIAMAALAMSSIFMASNANLLAKSYDRERDLKYAAEAALQIGKSRVNADPTILVLNSTQLDTTILRNYVITGANGLPLTGITVNVYVGPSGSTSGQFGRFSSIIAEARDQRGNGFIRRLELTQESFAKFAYWSNSENLGASTIYFNNNDNLWGPVWSNDTISIGSGGAVFHDAVGTVFFVSGANYGTFSKGYQQYQKPIALPSLAVLTNLQTISATSGWDFTTIRVASNTATSVRDRIEFVAFDLNASGDSTDLNEGMFRIYNANTDAAARGDWPVPNGTAAPTSANTPWCGDWHPTRLNGGGPSSDTLQFYPASVHHLPWFYTQIRLMYQDQNPAWTSTQLNTAAAAETTATLNTIMAHTNARCYLPGDPHLVAVERTAAFTDPITANPYATSAIQKGGLDSTFTPSGFYGSWKLNTNTPNATISALRRDAKYLYPIDRSFNSGAKGVIHFSGNVALSGTLNGRVTLYANGSIMLVDDIRYANDPVKGVCRDILGMISDLDIVIADNALNTPQITTGTTWRDFDETKDLYIHGVMMALGTSFRVENFNNGAGPRAVNNCNAVTNGRGCIYLSGGIIQQSRGPVGMSNGLGFSKQYTYDHCAVINPPPYFPTTGRFQDNRYLELDPAGFNHTTYFQTIVP